MKIIIKLFVICLLTMSILPVQRVLVHAKSSWVPTETEVRQMFSERRYENAIQTTGNVKVLVFLVDFPDKPNTNDSITAASVQQSLFSVGGKNEYLYPSESLSAFYQRSSYGKLNITGTVVVWYRAKYNRSHYSDQLIDLYEEVFNYYDANIDYNDYDADKDGIIDSPILSYAGGNEGSNSTWWSYVISGESFQFDAHKHDGISFCRLMLMDGTYLLDESTKPGYTTTLIHEMGHILGISDYYDSSGGMFLNNGATYSFDVMDNLRTDHNAFTKLIYGWIDKINIVSAVGTTQVTQASFSVNSEVTLIFPYENNLKEFFIVENLSYDGNFYEEAWINSEVQDGLRVWRVNLNYYNNTGVIKMIESVHSGFLTYAEDPSKTFAWNLMRPGDELSPTSLPSSFFYTLEGNQVSGKTSGVTIKDVEYSDTNINYNVIIDPLSETDEITFKPLKLGGNYLELFANTEFFIFDKNIKPYIKNGLNIIPLDYYLTTPDGTDSDLSNLLLYFDESKMLVHIDPSSSFTLIIPSGALRSMQGNVNEHLSIPLNQLSFPSILKEKTFKLDSFKYNLGYFSTGDDKVGFVERVMVENRNYRLILHKIDVSGREIVKDLGVKYSPNMELVSTTSLSSGAFVVAVHDLTTNLLSFNKFSPQGNFIKKETLEYNNYPYYDIIPFGDAILFRYAIDEPTVVVKIDFVNPKVIYPDMNIPGFRMGIDDSYGYDDRLFPLDNNQWILFDTYISDAITIVDSNLKALVRKSSDSNVDMGITLGAGRLSNGYIGQIIAYTKETESYSLADIYVNYLDSDLNVVYQKKIISSIEAPHGFSIDTDFSQFGNGFVLRIVKSPTPEKGGSPFTTSYFLDPIMNPYGEYTVRKPQQGVYVDAIKIQDKILFGWWNGYKVSNDYVMPVVSPSAIPTVSGMVDQGKYNTPISITYSGGIASLDGKHFESSSFVNTSGNHTLKIETPDGQMVTYQFSIDFSFPAVDGLKVTSKDISQISLAWNASKLASIYDIYRSASSTGEITKIASTPNASYVDHGLTTGESYSYRIQAVYTSGGAHALSPFSANVSAKAQPAQVEKLISSFSSFSSNRISWSAVTGASGYEIHRSIGKSKLYSLLSSETTLSFTNTSLEMSSKYNYKVRAYIMVGTTKVYGDFSSVVSATPLPIVPILLVLILTMVVIYLILKRKRILIRINHLKENSRIIIKRN